jgi:hypothetical protein
MNEKSGAQKALTEPPFAFKRIAHSNVGTEAYNFNIFFFFLLDPTCVPCSYFKIEEEHG